MLEDLVPPRTRDVVRRIRKPSARALHAIHEDAGRPHDRVPPPVAVHARATRPRGRRVPPRFLASCRPAPAMHDDPAARDITSERCNTGEFGADVRDCGPGRLARHRPAIHGSVRVVHFGSRGPYARSVSPAVPSAARSCGVTWGGASPCPRNRSSSLRPQTGSYGYSSLPRLGAGAFASRRTMALVRRRKISLTSGPT